MARIIADIKDVNNKLKVDIVAKIESNEGEERLVTELLVLALTNQMQLYNEAFKHKVQKAETVKTTSRNEKINNLIISRIIEYDF